MENNIIDVYNTKNQIEKIEILKYFKLRKNNKDYIIYRILNNTDNDNTLIFAAELMNKTDSIILMPIEEKEILQILKNIMSKMNKE